MLQFTVDLAITNKNLRERVEKMEIRLARSLQPDSIVDGRGIRTVIWTQGCSHNCKGCHNPETHSFNAGFLVNTEEVKKQIKELKWQDGITLSGGDPLFQIDACLDISEFCQSIGLNVWCYTGFTFEQLLEMSKKDPNLYKLLQNIDVLVDGKFIQEQKSLNLYFKGSKNQRILDLKESLKYQKPIEIEEYKKEKEFKSYARVNDGVYV